MQKLPPVYSLDLVLRPEQDDSYVHFENAGAHPFQPASNGSTPVNVWWLAECALLTYWDPADASVIFSRAGLDSRFLRVGSTDLYLAWQDEFVVVAFRGTEPDEWADMLTNSRFALVPWQTGKVHCGFKQAIDVVWPRLQEELDSLSASRRVWFCGHSLGAALATLAADRHSSPQGVCTFGCPRVGDRTFARAFSQRLAGRTLRYVNHYDVVTHVPPPLFGYKHVDVQRFIAPDGTVSSNPPPLVHFFGELIGRPEHLLEVVDGLKTGAIKTAPNYLLEHMPKAYAIWTWNDYDRQG